MKTKNTRTIPNKISEFAMKKRATRTESNVIENIVCTCSKRWCSQVFGLALLRPRVPEVHFLLGYAIMIKCGESEREKKNEKKWWRIKEKLDAQRTRHNC